MPCCQRVPGIESSIEPAAPNGANLLELALRAPAEFDVVTFTAGFDEFLVLSFLPAACSSNEIAQNAFTKAESEVAELALRGLSNEEMARARGVSPRTIANQIASIYRKMGVCSRRELRAIGGNGASASR